MPRYSFKRDPLTPDEVAKMISEAETPPLRALIVCLWLWGLRVGEALNLEKKDFTIYKRSVTLHIALEKKRKNTGPLIASHNINIKRTSPHAEILIAYLTSVSDGKVFPMSRWTARRQIKKLLSECSPHFFRHSRASRLAGKTDNVLELVDWFGWADPRPAMNYVQMSGRLAARLSNKVD